VDHRLYREYGGAPRGERIYQAVAAKGRERTSIIAASRQNKPVAPLVFQGSCNTEVVDVYFEQVLLASTPAGQRDRAGQRRLHRSPTTQKLVEAAGCRLLFLPPCSPVNPIEYLRAALKTRLRKALATASNPFLLSPIFPNVIVNFCNNTGWLQVLGGFLLSRPAEFLTAPAAGRRQLRL
jgi:hypothetical protein